MAVRIDVFLDVACLFPTRSQAARACDAHHVELNGQPARRASMVKPGDEIAIRTPGSRRTFAVRELRERNVPKAEARTLYEETTPLPTPEELELRRLTRMARVVRPAGSGRPTKRDRREIERLRGRS